MHTNSSLTAGTCPRISAQGLPSAFGERNLPLSCRLFAPSCDRTLLVCGVIASQLDVSLPTVECNSNVSRELDPGKYLVAAYHGFFQRILDSARALDSLG